MRSDLWTSDHGRGGRGDTVDDLLERGVNGWGAVVGVEEVGEVVELVVEVDVVGHDFEHQPGFWLSDGLCSKEIPHHYRP